MLDREPDSWWESSEELLAGRQALERVCASGAYQRQLWVRFYIVVEVVVVVSSTEK